MPDPVRGAHEKLKRANENIVNLQREIAVFLEEGEHRVIPNHPQVVEETVKSHLDRAIPDRFSVLIGEIVHHLRSCLDHIAWELSSATKRSDNPRGIEFPIYISKPSHKGEIKRYERKVEGISQRGRVLIERVQPYQRDPNFVLTGPRSDPLWIVHEMNTIDKHRELVLTTATFDIPLTGMEDILVMLYREANVPENDIVGLGRAFDPNSIITAQLAFRDFGGRNCCPVIPGISKLARHVERVLLMFERECF